MLIAYTSGKGFYEPLIKYRGFSHKLHGYSRIIQFVVGENTNVGEKSGTSKGTEGEGRHPFIFYFVIPAKAGIHTSSFLDTQIKNPDVDNI